ncbi:MAG: universal stress protein [Deltaproteobacteria bacterium]|nr:universal stress protein [Deltaproteobacteria bacterium]
MQMQMLHIFRNTPLGRETLLQTSYFCSQTGASPVIYVPENLKFLMYFENDVVQIDLDKSYLNNPETAKARAVNVIESMGLATPRFIEPKHFTASTLPDIPVNFEFMCCPRSISDLSSKIGLGHIGPRVRRIVKSATFPVLIPSMLFKPFTSIAVLFGGSHNAMRALRLGLRIQSFSGLPLDVFTQADDKRSQDDFRGILADAGLETQMDKNVRKWYFFDKSRFQDNLYEISHDALIVLGSYGHGLVKELLFGSTMEMVQSVMTNSMLIVGHQYRAGV